MRTGTRPVSEVKIGVRHRKDLGDLDGLAASIADIGLLQPIVVRPDGQLIAGERRLEACKRLGWTDIPVTVVELDEIVRGEFAENAIRKDFLPSEIDAIRRALEPVERAAAERRMRAGTPAKFSQGSGRATDKIGAFAGVSGRTVEKIAKVVDAARSDPETHGHLIGEMDEHGVDRAYKAIRRAKTIARIAAISNANAPLPRDRKYAIIMADPPWKFEVYDSETGLDHSADAHYPTMPLEEICELPVAGLATRDAVLFLWSTAPHLPHALDVLKAWGFAYCTNLVWRKDRIGTGYWLRNQHELLLIGRRGSFPAPEDRVRPSSVLDAPRREHSRKPDAAYVLIGRLYPELPKIELFARGKREGWAVWGNEAENDE
jgi:N6-adenosine-specific RNA methylase IME4/ParB-like chromosome segregation protein Spo0J